MSGPCGTCLDDLPRCRASASRLAARLLALAAVSVDDCGARRREGVEAFGSSTRGRDRCAAQAVPGVRIPPLRFGKPRMAVEDPAAKAGFFMSSVAIRGQTRQHRVCHKEVARYHVVLSRVFGEQEAQQHARMDGKGFQGSIVDWTSPEYSSGEGSGESQEHPDLAMKVLRHCPKLIVGPCLSRHRLPPHRRLTF